MDEENYEALVPVMRLLATNVFALATHTEILSNTVLKFAPTDYVGVIERLERDLREIQESVANIIRAL